MLNEIFLNEFDEAEYLISERVFNKSQSHTLLVLAKYYHANGYDKNQIYQKLEEFLVTCGEKPTNNMWVREIRKAVKDAPKQKVVMVNEILITDNEINTINTSLKSVMARRVAFTLLCLNKFVKAVTGNENARILYPDKTIMKLANVNTSTLRQGLIYRELEEAGLVKFSNQVDGISKYVLIESKGDVMLKVTVMNNLGYQFMKLKDDKSFSVCENCGTTFKVKDPINHPYQKYCSECAKKVYITQTKDCINRKRACLKVSEC